MAFQELQTLLKSAPKPESKSNTEIEVGHSALASYAVLGLLGIPLFMAISGTMSNDASPLLYCTWQESRDVDEGDYGYVERVAGADEAGCLDRGIDV